MSELLQQTKGSIVDKGQAQESLSNLQLPLYQMKSESAHLYYSPPTSHSSSSALASASVQGTKPSVGAVCSQQMHNDEPVSTTIGSPPQQRKRIKRDTVSSISSTEDDIDSVGGENELERSGGGRLLQPTSTSNFRFQKSPPGLQSSSSIWPVSQESHRDLATKVINQSPPSPPHPPALGSPHLIRSRIEGAVGFMPVSASGSSHILQDRNGVGSPLSPTSHGSHLPSRIVPQPALNRQTHSPLSISPGTSVSISNHHLSPMSHHLTSSSETAALKYNNDHNNESDFVALVCENSQQRVHQHQLGLTSGSNHFPFPWNVATYLEMENRANHIKSDSQNNTVKSPTKLPQFYASGMPPPPLAPIPRPMAIIQMADGQMISAVNAANFGSGPAASSAPTSSSSSSTSPVATPINRGIMSSPFTVIQGRPEHGFVHIHSQPAHSLMFSYPSVSPVTALSGVISPTTFNNILSSSPVATPRTTPRSTPVPRWCTPIIIDENQDFAVMINMVTANSSDDILMQEGGCLDRYLHMMPCSELLDSNNSISSMAHHQTSTVSASTSESLDLHRHESADPTTSSCTKKC
jgi:hypothetical protein